MKGQGTMRWQRCVALVGAMAACAGCGASPPPEDAATQAAVAFHRAADAGDKATACAILAPAVRESVSGDSSCAEEIGKAGLPRAGAVRSTAVYGRQAQVWMDGDVVFLTAVDGGWRIWAAGCSTGNDGTYDCAVKR